MLEMNLEIIKPRGRQAAFNRQIHWVVLAWNSGSKGGYDEKDLKMLRREGKNKTK